MNKISKAREALLAMEFLGIDSEKFQELKEEHSGLDALHRHLESQITGDAS